MAFWPVERSSSACHAGGSPAGAVLSRIAGRRGQVEFLDAHQHLGLSLGEALALG